MNILHELQSRFATALSGMVDNPAELLLQVRASQDPKFGDYQANCAMPLGKRLGKPPRQIATAIVAKLEIDDLCEPPEIAGPGFINLRLKNDWLAQQASTALADPRVGVPTVAKPRTYVVDYSAPNVAKPMHVGHIRSTVIGNCLYRTLKFVGHEVISDNHLGDWGTQFGMIIYGYKSPEIRAQVQSSGAVEKLGEFGALYAWVNRLGEENPKIREAVLNETVKLHAGDAENLQLWKEIRTQSDKDIDRIYKRLGVKFDDQLGESFYHDWLSAVVDDLQKKEIGRESDGAIGVFLNGYETPFLIRKQDGAFLYATTDLATIQYRMETWHPDAVLYVVDHRQSLHFEQLFATARLWHPEWANVEFKHVNFGTVLGKDGKPFKTRSGDTVGLEILLDEGVSRALAIVSANDDAKPNGPELSTDERQKIAEAVGIGALKYADLSQNRTSDYVFDYDKMLAMNGNTATYMQYAHARVRGIFIKGQKQLGESTTSQQHVTQKIILSHPAERALALAALQFSEAMDLVLADYRPNQLTSYLFELANRFSTFYENCPVLKAETPELLHGRLALCNLTAKVLRQGLELLGIEVVERM
ncbi:MAG TPA: arginine--tRNA ligase [Pirellulales bacterium]|nr:arginine--tRNA ligase [Pirellulales bacterium]